MADTLTGLDLIRRLEEIIQRLQNHPNGKLRVVMREPEDGEDFSRVYFGEVVSIDFDGSGTVFLESEVKMKI